MKYTFETEPGLTLLRTLQRTIPLRNPSLKSSSEGSAGKSLPLETPSVSLSHAAASYLRKATYQIYKSSKSRTSP